MSLFKRRQHRNKTNRIKPRSPGHLLRGLVSFDLLEQRVLFAVLPAPTGSAAVSPSTNEVDLSWNDSSGETGYIVQTETATTPRPRRLGQPHNATDRLPTNFGQSSR